jgi:hypothetical protein
MRIVEIDAILSMKLSQVDEFHLAVVMVRLTPSELTGVEIELRGCDAGPPVFRGDAM